MVLPFKDMMFRFAKRMLKGVEDAEDVVQDAFLKLWLKRDELKSNGNMQALVMITTKNLCLDKLKAKYRTFIKLEDDDILQDELNPAHHLEAKELQEKMDKVIDSLPEQQKMLIHLRDVEGLSNEEAAKIMNMNEGTVRANLSRARQKIRTILTKKYGYIYYEN